MGQRLVISIITKDEEGQIKDLAKCYMHWSGYTDSSLAVTKTVLNSIARLKKFYPTEKVKEQTSFAVSALLNGLDGSGVSKPLSFERIYGREMTEKDLENISRNNGLIACEESEMAELQDWSEGDVYIDITDISNPLISFCVLCQYNDYQDFVESYFDGDEKEAENSITIVEDTPEFMKKYFDTGVLNIKDFYLFDEYICDAEYIYFKDYNIIIATIE